MDFTKTYCNNTIIYLSTVLSCHTSNFLNNDVSMSLKIVLQYKQTVQTFKNIALSDILSVSSLLANSLLMIDQNKNDLTLTSLFVESFR